MKRILKCLLSLLLCAIMVSQSVTYALAATPVYISDIKMVNVGLDIGILGDELNSKFREDAAKELMKAGYTVINGNNGYFDFNAGADGGCCLIGYKTTTNPDEAITDLRVMDMNGGYIKSTYDGVNEASRQGLETMTEGMMAAVKEVRENYQKGSPAAKYAIELLNGFYVDSLGGMLLGDAIKEGKITNDIAKNFMIYASGRTVSVVFTNLLVGCAEYNENGETWIDRAQQISLRDYNKDYDSKMYDKAEYFVNAIEDTGIKIYAACEAYESLRDKCYQQAYDKKYNEVFPGLLDKYLTLLNPALNPDPYAGAGGIGGIGIGNVGIGIGGGTIGGTTGDYTGGGFGGGIGIGIGVSIGGIGIGGGRGIIYDPGLEYDRIKAEAGSMAKKEAADIAKAYADSIDLEEAWREAYLDMILLAETELTEDATQQEKDEQKEAIEMLYYFNVLDLMNEYTVYVPSIAVDSSGEAIKDDKGEDKIVPVECLLGNSLWGWTDTMRFEPEWCYPVYDAMTPAQRALVPFCGIETLATVTVSNTEEEIAQRKADAEKQALAAGYTSSSEEPISLFWDIDYDFLKDSVYLTDRAARTLASQNEESALADAENGAKRMAFDHMQYCSIIFGVLAVFDMGIAIYAAITDAAVGVMALFDVIIGSSTACFSAVFSGIVGILGYATMLVFVCFAVVYLICYLCNKYGGPTYTEMPEILYDARPIEDSRRDVLVRYNLVRQPNGREADMNAKHSDKWLALYYSKDEKAGTPILADFLTRTGHGETPNGYYPLRLFGGRTAVNTNLYAYYDTYDGLYLFFRRDGDMYEYKEEGAYFRTLKVLHGDNEGKLKKWIESSEEYLYFNVNLTPGQGYTYLSYSTTDYEWDAIRDIRVIYGLDIDNSNNGFKIGTSGYASAGYAAGLTYLTSKQSVTGDPIFVDSLLVVRDNSVPVSYIPVCHASGGPAVDLNCDREYGYYDSDETIRLYFKSKRAANDNDDTVYLSGFAEINMAENLIYESAWKPEDAIRRAQELGYTPIYDTNRYSTNWKPLIQDLNVATVYGYSTTTYYKRALQNIIVADGDIKQNVQVMSNGIAHVVIPGITRIDYSGKGAKDKHTYPWDYQFGQSCNVYAGDTLSWMRNHVDSAPQIYTAPATSKDNAIKMDDFRIINRSEYNRVQNMIRFEGYTYATSVYDRTGEGLLLGTNYLLYKGTPKTAGKYISGIVYGFASNDAAGRVASKVAMVNQGGCDQNIGSFTTILEHKSYYTIDYAVNIGVTRTNNKAEAITDIKLLVYEEGQTVPKQLTFQKEGIMRLVNPEPIMCWYTESGYTKQYVYMYVSTNPTAGSPITNLSFIKVSDGPLMDGVEFLEYEKYGGIWYSETIDNVTYDYGWTWLPGSPKFHTDRFFKVWREAPNQYYSDLSVYWKLTHNVWESNYPEIVGTYNLYANGIFTDDLSYGAGGYYMNLVYKRTSKDWEAITGIVQLSVDYASEAPTNIDYKGITYTKIHNGDCPDLNKGAGGKYVYLYSTKDTRAGAPITDLRVRIGDSENQELTPGYKWTVETHSGQRGDLNQDAGGAWVFLEYKREWETPDNPWAPEAPDAPIIDVSWIDDWLGAGVASFFGKLSPASYVIIGIFLGGITTAFAIGIVLKRKKKKVV